jgi:hypothetical protein
MPRISPWFMNIYTITLIKKTSNFRNKMPARAAHHEFPHRLILFECIWDSIFSYFKNQSLPPEE